MNFGITVDILLGSLKFEAAGKLLDDKTLALSGALINEGQIKGLRALMSELCEYFGMNVNTDFILDIVIDVIGFAYNSSNTKYTIYMSFKDSYMKELGRTQLQYSNKDWSLSLIYTKGFSLSELPIAGDYISKVGDVTFKNISAGYEKDKGFMFNMLLEAQILDKEIDATVIEFNIPNNKTKSIYTMKNANEERLLTNAYENKIKWKAINKTFGAVTLQDIGGAFCDGEILILMNAGLKFGGIEFSFDGLGISVPFSDLSKTRPTLSGINISVKTSSVEISGGFYHSPDSASYAGMVMVKLKTFSFSLIGSYASSPVTSIFAAAAVNAPIGGPPCFFVNGFAAGFGYNRRLMIPDIEHLSDFPLFKLADGTMKLDDISKLDQYFCISEGNYWLSAGIFFSSFELIESQVILTVAFGNYVEINLLGRSVLDIPMSLNGAVIAHVVLLLKASFRTEDFLVSVEAMLSNDSYVLSKSCHLTGGFAFYMWYGGIHSGDFVLTLGGYNNTYKKPEHYPTTKRVGMKWRIYSSLYAEGSLYFALTPSCIMAGGHLKCVFTIPCVEVWFDAELNILVKWKPFYYDFFISLYLGVKVDLWLFTVKLELGASLHLWGPDFSGIARIYLWCISFDIRFINSSASTQTNINPKEFNDTFLPKTDNKSKLLSESADGLGGYDCCSIQAAEGLIRDYAKDGLSYWSMSADTLKIIIKSKVPLKLITLNGVNCLSSNQTFGIYPCAITNISPTLELVLIDDKGKTIDITPLVEEIDENVPFALWGIKGSKENPETILAMTGMSFMIPKREYYTLQCRQDFELVSKKYEVSNIPIIESIAYDQQDAYQLIARTITDASVEQKRDNIIKDIVGKFDIELLNLIADSPVKVFCYKPTMSTLGGEKFEICY